ncbi:MAG: ParB N-terminal domain-containing protein [Deltaproteobacteria bacterium]|nr:ParB N-terminal domain-containing protein [Deltaproteobacteria bacterium]
MHSASAQEYVRLDNSQVGESLSLARRTATVVDLVVDDAAARFTYDIEVEDEHHYFVGDVGVRVHNNPCDDATTSKLVGRQGKNEYTGNQIKSLKKKMKRDGFDRNHPIEVAKVDGKNIIIDGHHRARAAGAAGIKKVPIKEVKVSAERAATLKIEAIEAAENLGLPRPF